MNPPNPVQNLLVLLEVPMVRLLYEAEFFLGEIEPIFEAQLVLGAVLPGTPDIEMFPYAAGALGTYGRRDLAIYSYAWALQRIAAGRTLASVCWAHRTAVPLELDPQLTLAAFVRDQPLHL